MSLEGDLSELPFAEIVQLYGTGRQPVAVHLFAPDVDAGEGYFCLEEGKLTEARFGPLSGREAFRRALALQEGKFRVEIGVRSTSNAKPEILTHVLLEELSKLDIEKVAPPRPPPPRPALPIRPPPAAPILHASGGASASETPIEEPVEMASERKSALFPKLESPAVASHRGRSLFAIVGVALIVVSGAALLLRRSSAKRAAVAVIAPVAAMPRPTAAIASPVRGVSAGEVLLGMAAPLNGPTSDLGLAVKVGLELAFSEVNDAGGIHGRKLKLITLDDLNDPAVSARVVQELIEQRQVFAVVGNAGTATASAVLPQTQSSKVLYFGAISGARSLRKTPPDRYVFNFRPSLAEETGAALHYLTHVRKIAPDRIAVFSEEGEFGEAGIAGIAEAFKKEGNDPGKILRVSYASNRAADVQAAVAQLRAAPSKPRAVIMIATHEPAARFIERVKSFAPEMVFTDVSAVNAVALAERLKEDKVSADLIVTQVVPSLRSKASVVERYRALAEARALGDQTSPLSLEGYVVGRLFAEGLRLAGPNLDTERLVAALQGIRDLDIGIGPKLSFGEREHQASHKVWGTVLNASWSYEPVELE